MLRRLRAGVIVALTILWLLTPPVGAQAPDAAEPASPAAAVGGDRPGKVDVQTAAADHAIQERLARILEATGWYQDPKVEVRAGVAFLHGIAQDDQRRRWASDLARGTEDVVVVVNQMELGRRSIWDLSGAFEQLRDLIARMVSSLPGIGFALIVLLCTWLAARGVRAFAAWVAQRRLRNALLRRVVARAAAIIVIVLGVYVVLYVSGLTRLAVTVLGGTGLVGLVVGVAFRDITENFLASIFLSLQQPFRMDDLVELAGHVGLVQRTTFRTTILLTLDGNHVQVPNATVYKSVIRNFTSNPSRREQFDVGIGYQVPITKAQEVARRVLKEHPAVLDQPEPWVLVDSLGSATVVLRIYFWLDGTKHSWLKVRSSVIRLVKLAFQEAGVDMPDEAREVVFPQGLAVRMVQDLKRRPDQPARASIKSDSREAATDAEGELATEAGALKQQAHNARSPEAGENLLRAERGGTDARSRAPN